MLVVKNISKTFNKGTANEKQALNDVCLTLNDGDFCTVIGSNGAGKSTLLNCIAGVFPPNRGMGSIFIDDVNLTFSPEYKRAKYIGRVFQDPLRGTAADMGIDENLALAMRRGKSRGLSWGISEKEKKSYRDLIASLGLGLENRLTAKVGLLSGGQRQAITLLMATLVKPKLLLLDEHTAALDPKTAAKVLELTEKFILKDKLTALMITHNMRDAIRFGNRLIMMDSGRIVYDVSGEEKEKLTVSALLEKFEIFAKDSVATDRMLLG